jgi:hypothetical protein
MTSRDTKRSATCGVSGRSEDELLAALLPIETPSEKLPIAYAIPVSTIAPGPPTGMASHECHSGNHSWQPFIINPDQQSQRPRMEEAIMAIPPPPSDHVYRDDSQGRLSMAQQQGLEAAQEESLRISEKNRRVDAYNNQMEFGIHRANEIARMENERERRLQNLTIASPPPAATSATNTASSRNGEQRRASEKDAYFSPPKKGGTGYQVKEYDIREHERDYSYDIPEYKMDYDDTEKESKENHGV